MSRLLCAFIIFSTGVVTQARSAEDGVAGQVTSFQAARQSDVICSDPANSPEQRLDCFQKARAAQLECLDHVPLGVTESTEALQVVSPQKSASQLETGNTVAPMIVAPKPDKIVGPMVATAPSAPSPVETTPASPAKTMPPSVSDTAAVDLVKPLGSNWTISETTSPIDYSPVVIATVRSASQDKDAPNVLSITCRRLRPEITLRTEGAWRTARNGKVQVAVQIDGKSASSTWNLSVDGKTATNPDHAAELLQSLPEGAALKVNLSDGADHNATFELAGLDIVRRKVSTACKLAPPPDSKLSLGKP